MAIVYLATNSVNGKRYIGVTRKPLHMRMYQHHYAAKNGSSMVFAKAIRKHGKDAFSFEILQEVETYKEALNLERQLISSLKPEYNTAAGGIGPSGVKWSKSRRDKMLVSLKASWTPERKESASKDAKARVTPESRAWARLRLKPPVKFKPIICLNDGLKFEGIKHAEAHYGIGNISAVITGIQHACGNGLSFALQKDCKTDEDRFRLLAEIAAKRMVSELKIKGGLRSRQVREVGGSQTIFNSASDAARKIGVSIGRISQICNGNGTLKDGRRFMWNDQEGPPEIKRASPEQMVKAKQDILNALSRGLEKNKKPVICVDNGTVYSSISDAARAHGVCVASVSAAIHRQGKSAGLKFEFVEAA